MKKRKIVDAAIRESLQAVQPTWDSTEQQELNARGWFDTKAKDINIITRYGSSSLLMTTVNAILLNGIAAGSDNDERKGRTIYMNQLTFRFSVQNTGHYLYIVYDRAPNGAAPDLTFGEGNTFFTNNDAGAAWPAGGVASQFVWPVDDNDGRLTWLAGIRVNTENQNATTTVDLRRLPVQYSGTGNTIASITTGALYMVIVNASTGSITFNRGWQLSYFDA